MNTRIKRATATASTAVEVVITVTQFKDVLGEGASRGGRGTAYRMRLARKHPLAFIKGDNLHLKAPGAPIRFTLASAAGGKARYFPVGIAFVRQGPASESDEQRLGLLNFPQDQLHVGGLSLSVLDAYREKSAGVRFKFSIAIQRGADGRIGIVDPGIVHEDEQ